MKVICIEDRVFDMWTQDFINSKLPSITKGKIYECNTIKKVNGNLHYFIRMKSGRVNYYYHTRFKEINKNTFTKLKII